MRSKLSRRAFLTQAGALTGGAMAWRLAGGWLPTARAMGPFLNPLRIPTVLTGDHITLTAAETTMQVRPGAPTAVWAFNGEFPGPTIRRPAGARTQVTVHHQLAAIGAESLTIHLHGGHTASQFDGQPERFVIEPGASYTYDYELMEDGEPERGALQWYHDHSHFRTGRNVWMGLAGMFVIDDPDDEARGLPIGDHDIPLMIADRLLDRSNQLRYPFPADEDRPPVGDGSPPFADAIGNVVLVNGTERPYLDVAPGRYRFRILNASNFRPYNLAIPDLGPVIQVGTESGLLPLATTRDAVLLGPAERAEVVVDFSHRAGDRLVMQSVALDSPRTIPATPPFEVDVMEFRVDTTPSPVPAAALGPLPALPAWASQAPLVPDRVFTFGLGIDPQGRSAWTINGRAFDHHRIDARPEIDSVETWMLVNDTPTSTSHYIHIHGGDWVVLSRNGEPPGHGDLGLKETFRVDPGEVLVVASKFTDHLGVFMIHCHMLEHEDHGMMTTYEVVEQGRGDLLNPVPGVTSSLPPSSPHDAGAQRLAPATKATPLPSAPVYCDLTARG